MVERKNLISLVLVLTVTTAVLLFLNLRGFERTPAALLTPEPIPVKLSRSEVNFFTVGKISNKAIFYESLDSIVYETDLDGRNKKEWARVPGAKEIVFSPDGRKMVASFSERGETRKYRFDLVENKKIALDPKTKAAAFSPDGSMAAYYFYDDGTGEGGIRIAGPDDQEIEILKTRIRSADLSWPEEEVIVFSTFAVRPDGKGFQTLEKTNAVSDSETAKILEGFGIEASAVQTSAFGNYLVYVNAKDKKLYSLKVK